MSGSVITASQLIAQQESAKKESWDSEESESKGWKKMVMLKRAGGEQQAANVKQQIGACRKRGRVTTRSESYFARPSTSKGKLSRIHLTLSSDGFGTDDIDF